ncbi:MAG: ribonuclease R [Nitrospirota bacterium]|nr:ribonuclease R [Nitrospirota bacterium]
MNSDDIREIIVNRSGHPLEVKDIARLAGVKGAARRELKRLLQELVERGEIVRVRGDRYGPPKKMNMETGVLQCHPEGYGFVRMDQGGDDIFVGPRSMEGAMHGDRVVVRLEGVRKFGRREARVVRVLERRTERVVGRFERDRRYCWVVPSNPRILTDILIPVAERGEARHGQVVTAEITRYPMGGRSPEGRVVRVLGWGDEAGVDIETIIEAFQLPVAFPHDVLAEAKRIPREVQESAFAGREDLRQLPTVTIDGETAKDFDDAVSVKKHDDGRIRLWVHIADVSHYVKEKAPLDEEAYRRGTSVYFPDRAIPMLPEALSNGICSLNPQVDRLTVTCEIVFDKEGKRLDYRLYDSVIKSDERMTYTAVREILVDKDPAQCARYRPLLGDFAVMEELFGRLNKKRKERGSIDFDLPEPQIILDIQGKTTAIIESERNVAHRIIEEFMLAANETVAEHMARREVPFIYRVHDEPDPGKIADFQEFAAQFKVGFKAVGKITPSAFCGILEQVAGRPEEKLINQVLLRSMKQACYVTENVGHFGLAAEYYTHFTSPIRRYPDLIVHRILKEQLSGKLSKGKKEHYQSVLPDIARRSSERERIAMEAEREVVSLKKAQFMSDKVGQEFAGLVSGVTAFGLFVELTDIFVEGLIHVSALRDDYYAYEEKKHRLVGERTGRTFTIGDPVRVRVEKVDLERKRVDFELVRNSDRKP